MRHKGILTSVFGVYPSGDRRMKGIEERGNAIQVIRGRGWGWRVGEQPSNKIVH